MIDFLKKHWWRILLVILGVVLLVLWTLWGVREYNKQQSLHNSVLLAWDYLVDVQEDDGSFIYLYDPDEQISLGWYNILRHAGTVYSLLEIYAYSNDDKYLEAAELWLWYLQRQIQDCSWFASDALCLVENNEVKLWWNALAILAMGLYTELTDRDDFVLTMQWLAAWILSVQNNEWEFVIHKMDMEWRVSDFVSQYYPWEGLYALAKLYDITWVDTYIRAAYQWAIWLITVRDAWLTLRNIAHDHWLLYALRDIYRHYPDTVLVQHGQFITNSIISRQRLEEDTDYKPWVGSFMYPPRTTPTSTRMEWLIAAHTLFSQAWFTNLAESIEPNISLGIWYIRGSQLLDGYEWTLWYGWFPESLTESAIRIDYVQHAISALLWYLSL